MILALFYVQPLVPVIVVCSFDSSTVSNLKMVPPVVIELNVVTGSGAVTNIGF